MSRWAYEPNEFGEVNIGGTWYQEWELPSPSELAMERHDDDHPNPDEHPDCEVCKERREQPYCYYCASFLEYEDGTWVDLETGRDLCGMRSVMTPPYDENLPHLPQRMGPNESDT